LIFFCTACFSVVTYQEYRDGVDGVSPEPARPRPQIRHCHEANTQWDLLPHIRTVSVPIAVPLQWPASDSPGH